MSPHRSRRRGRDRSALPGPPLRVHHGPERPRGPVDVRWRQGCRVARAGPCAAERPRLGGEPGVLDGTARLRRVRRGHAGTPQGPSGGGHGRGAPRGDGEAPQAQALVSARAASLLTAAGHGASADTLRRVSDILEAVAATPAGSVGARVQPGRLTSDLEPPGFDAIGPFVPAASPSPSLERRPAVEASRRRTVLQAAAGGAGATSCGPSQPSTGRTTEPSPWSVRVPPSAETERALERARREAREAGDAPIGGREAGARGPRRARRGDAALPGRPGARGPCCGCGSGSAGRSLSSGRGPRRGRGRP